MQKRILLFLALMLPFMGMGIQAQDDCSTAADISSLFTAGPGVAQTSSLFDNTGATTAPTDPTTGQECWFDNTLDGGIWASFSLAEDGIFDIITVFCDATTPNDDTQFALYSGNCGSLTPVACNDDIDGNNMDYRAAIQGINLVGGTDYYLLIDGWDGTEGEFCLEVTEIQVITCDSIDAGSITIEAPIVCFNDGSIVTQNDDAVLPVGVGGDVNGYAIAISTTDLTGLAEPLMDPGFLGLFGIQTAPYSINFANDGDPLGPGIYYYTPIAMAGGVYPDPNNPTFASIDFSSGCIDGGVSQQVEFIAEDFTFDATVAVTPDTDPTMGGAVATVTATGGLGMYSYVWDTGDTTATVDSLDFGVYSVTVSDAGAAGYSCIEDIVLQVSVVEPVIINPDECLDAPNLDSLLVGGVGVSLTSSPFDNSNATTSMSDPIAGFECWLDGPTVDGGLWATFSPATDGLFDIVTVICDAVNNPIPGGDTQFALYSGDCGNLTPVACADDISSTDFRAAFFGIELIAGTQYYLFMDGWQAAAGEYCLEFTEVVEITCDQISAGGASYNATTICFNDSLNITADGLDVIPQLGGDWTGFTYAASAQDISGSTDPFMETSFLGAFPISPEGRDILFINNPANGLPAGTYFITPIAFAGGVDPVGNGTFTDIDFSNGCAIAGQSTEVTLLPEYSQPVVFVTTEPALDNNEDGSATANASGGSGNFTYEWDNGATTAAITGLPAGDYTVTVTDATGCFPPFVETVTVDAVSATNDPALSAAIQLFPNPTSGLVTMRYEFTKSFDAVVTINNALGQTIVHQQLLGAFAGSLEFDLSQFPSGVYTLRLTDGKRQTVRPILVR